MKLKVKRLEVLDILLLQEYTFGINECKVVKNGLPLYSSLYDVKLDILNGVKTVNFLIQHKSFEETEIVWSEMYSNPSWWKELPILQPVIFKMKGKVD